MLAVLIIIVICLHWTHQSSEVGKEDPHVCEKHHGTSERGGREREREIGREGGRER